MDAIGRVEGERALADVPERVLSASAWAVQQYGMVDLGNRRRTQRAVAMAAQMAARPNASLLAQMEDHAALVGAYVLLNNPVISLEALVAPHCQQTLAQAAQQQQVLFVEDTTELDYTSHHRTAHLGPLGNGTSRGLLLHSTLAVTQADRQVLGLAHVAAVLRQAPTPPRSHRRRSPEGLVWETSAQAVGSPPAGVVWIHVSDRGSDDFAYAATCVDLHKDFVIRLQHNRVLTGAPDAPPAAEPNTQHLLDYARRLPVVEGATYAVHLPAQQTTRKKVAARTAQVVVAWAKVSLPPPGQIDAPWASHAPLAVWVLRAWEPAPPPDCDPLEWILLTSRPMETTADALQVVDAYTCRWLCEDYHQCLKTGCQIERSQLDDGEDLRRLLGFATPLAVRLLQIRQAARAAPEVPATTCLDQLTVEVLCRRLHLAAPPLTLRQFWQAVARLGGHQGRKSDGPPGWRTLWLGWSMLQDWAFGARLILSADHAAFEHG